MHECVVFCTTESDRQATNPNPQPYFVAVKYGGLASLYRKFTFAISRRLMSFLFHLEARTFQGSPRYEGFTAYFRGWVVKNRTLAIIKPPDIVFWKTLINTADLFYRASNLLDRLITARQCPRVRSWGQLDHSA